MQSRQKTAANRKYTREQTEHAAGPHNRVHTRTSGTMQQKSTYLVKITRQMNSDSTHSPDETEQTNSGDTQHTRPGQGREEGGRELSEGTVTGRGPSAQSGGRSSNRHSITQMRVDYTLRELYDGTQKPLIHVFGRDQNHHLWEIEVHGFQPYFYVPASQAPDPTADRRVQTVDYGAETINGVEMARVTTARPRDVRQLRDDYDHHEADIPFTRRFLIDTNIQSGVSFPADAIRTRPNPQSATHGTPASEVANVQTGKAVLHHNQLEPVTQSVSPRIQAVDIEVEDRRGFPDAESASEPLLCLTTYDSFSEEYIVWTRQAPGASPDAYPDTVTGYSPVSNHLHGDEPDSDLVSDHVAPSDVEIRPFPTETTLLAAYCTYVQRTNPDVITGWNISYDTEYLINRINASDQPELTADRLSRLDEAWVGSYGTPTIKGRSVFDMLEGYKQLQQTKQQSYRLEDIAQRELGVGKQSTADSLGSLWETNPAQLIQYNLRDVELLVALEAQEELITFWDDTRRFVGCSLESALNTGDLCDAYVLHSFSEEYALPSKGAHSGSQASPSGGHVFDPFTGIEDCIGVLDLKSLYPMLMCTLNASPDTKVDPDSYTGETIEAPNGTHFRTDEDGGLRTLISDLLTERDRLKAVRDTHDPSTDAYARLDRQQAATKVVMNALYGTFGWTQFRLYDPDITEAITSTGRELIKFTADCAEACGYSVVYGDSDSILIDIPQLSFADVRAVGPTDLPTDPASLGSTSSVSVPTGSTSSTPDDESVSAEASERTDSVQPVEPPDDAITIAAHVARHPPDSVRDAHPSLAGGNKDGETDSLSPALSLSPAVVQSSTGSSSDTAEHWGQAESEQLVTAVAQLFWLQEYINSQYDRFARERFGLESHRFVLEAESVYWPYLQAGKKKRYAGRVRWSDERFTDELSITGFEYKRSDTAPLTKRVQQTVIEMLLSGRPSTEVVSYLQEIISAAHAGEIDIWELAIPEGINQPLSSYDHPTAHQRGAQYANALLDTHFAAGSTPRRLYLNSVRPQFWERLKQADTLDPQARPEQYQAYREFRQRTDVICLSDPEQLPPEFIIDVQTMLEKTIRKPLSRVLQATDLDWDAIAQQQTQPQLDDFM